MPAPYRPPTFPDLQPIAAAASTVAELLQELRKAGWVLHSNNAGWRVAKLGDEQHAYAVLNDVSGHWCVSHVCIPLEPQSLSAADRLRALADQLEREAQDS
jgi:hypothetical protein